jgi:Spy/CpxP family protein refolding chaperone
MIVAITAILIAFSAQAQEDSAGDTAIFRSQVDQLNERYENFFTRQGEQRQYAERLKMGVPGLKEQRRSEMREAARALREFKLEPKIKPDTSAAEAQWEAEKQARARIHERHRKSFVERRAELRRISESARKIPENQDAGLE